MISTVDIRLQETEYGFIALNMESGTYFRLNRVAGLILRKIMNDRSLDGLTEYVKKLSSHTPEDSIIEADISAAVDTFIDAGIIVL